MKTIELIKEREDVVINGKTQEIEIGTLELLDTAINSPAKGGYSVSDMLTRIKLLDIVREVRKSQEDGNLPTTISFEDADYKILAQLVKETKWSILSRVILEFCQSFEK